MSKEKEESKGKAPALIPEVSQSQLPEYSTLQQRKRELDIRWSEIMADLEKDQGELQKEKQEWATGNTKFNQDSLKAMVALDIGGKPLELEKEDVLNGKSALLRAMFSGRFPLKPQESGAYFLDCDYFPDFDHLVDVISGQPFNEGVLEDPERFLREAAFFEVEGVPRSLNDVPAGLTASSQSKAHSPESLEALHSSSSKSSKTIATSCANCYANVQALPCKSCGTAVQESACSCGYRVFACPNCSQPVPSLQSASCSSCGVKSATCTSCGGAPAAVYCGNCGQNSRPAHCASCGYAPPCFSCGGSTCQNCGNASTGNRCEYCDQYLDDVFEYPASRLACSKCGTTIQKPPAYKVATRGKSKEEGRVVRMARMQSSVAAEPVIQMPPAAVPKAEAPASTSSSEDTSFKSISDAFDSMISSARATKASIADARQRLRADKAAWGGLEAKLNKVFSAERLVLNVRGTRFSVSPSLLKSGKSEFFAGMLEGDYRSKLKEDGSLFISRSPAAFPYVLQFLRSEMIPSNLSEQQRRMLLEDAAFYKIPALTERLNKPQLESTIVTQTAHANQLFQWLPPRSKLTLLYRGTRDGRSSSTFHSRCDNRTPTLTVIRVNSYIFGGYTAQRWNHQGNVNDPSAWLFSLVNASGAAAVKIPVHPSYTGYAINAHNSYGPYFGGGEIYITNNWSGSTTTYNGYYTAAGQQSSTFFAGTQQFTPTEVEVFQVSTMP